MAKSCFCDRLLRRAVTDSLFRSLPAVVRHVWLELVALGIAAPEPGRIRFFGSVSGSLSRMLSLAETDVETGLQTLVQVGLLELEEAASTLWLPGARENLARSQSAKINGLRGGRPRKGESLAEARARRQGNLMLPIVGAAETQETECEPNPESSHARAAATALAKAQEQAAEKKAVPALAGNELLALANEVADLTQQDRARSSWTAREVQAWLEMGASPELVRTVVGEMVRRPNFEPGRSFRYYTCGIRDALASGRQVEAPVASNAAQHYVPGWTEALTAHVDAGRDPTAFPSRQQWAEMHRLSA